MEPANSWNIEFFYSGLVMFVRDASGSVAQALLCEGRQGGRGHGRRYPQDDPNCQHLKKSDFDHYPVLCWKQGASDPQHAELERVRLEFKWSSNGIPVELALGASPVGPSKVKGLPVFEGDGSNWESFFWIPGVEEVGPKNNIAPDCLANQLTDDTVVAQVPVEAGRISTAGFGWVQRSVERSSAAGHKVTVTETLIPLLRFATGPEEPSPLKRAAGEMVRWRPRRDEVMDRLKIWAVALDPERGNDRRQIVSLESGGGPLRLHILNNPAPRCPGDIHPGRRVGASGPHFEMFYPMLEAPTHPATRRVPWAPANVRLSRLILGPNHMVYPPDQWEVLTRLMWECSVPGGTEGAVDRPLCVPTSGSA